MTIAQKLRNEYHKDICNLILFIDLNGIPNNADKHSKLSVTLAQGIVSHLQFPMSEKKPSDQTRNISQITK